MQHQPAAYLLAFHIPGFSPVAYSVFGSHSGHNRVFNAGYQRMRTRRDPLHGLLGAFMCWDNKNRAFGFTKDPFADATHEKLIHRTSSMRTYYNHINIEF